MHGCPCKSHQSLQGSQEKNYYTFGQDIRSFFQGTQLSLHSGDSWFGNILAMTLCFYDSN
jgi:hypothetical protein